MRQPDICSRAEGGSATNISRPSLGSRRLSPCALSKTGWLAEQPADFRERMVGLGSWRAIHAGQGLYKVGDESNAIFGLEDGLVDIPISDDEMVTLHRAASGVWIGDSALFSDKPRVVSVTAHCDSLVFAIPARALKRHITDRAALQAEASRR